MDKIFAVVSITLVGCVLIRFQGKVTATNEELAIVFEEHVSYDLDLPEFGTVGGVCTHEDNLTVTVPTAMLLKTLDKLLDKMAEAGFDFGKVVAIGGGTMGNGTVYWKTGARHKLNNLKTEKPLFEQLKDELSVPDSPSWQDTSTTEQCRQIEHAVGGQMEIARITGSKAIEHNAASQIRKLYQTQRSAYDNTEHISLFSSFMASLFIGDYAPIDYGDGTTMNLLDLTTKQWSSKCLDACAPGLAEKLGALVPSQTILGNVCPYLVQKYKFSEECKVLAFTADALQSLVAVGAQDRTNELIVGLGTGDFTTVSSRIPTPILDGYCLNSTLIPDSYYRYFVFMNASLQRQHIMEECAGSWEKFTELFFTTPPGNNENLGIYVEIAEMDTKLTGRFRFNESDELVDSFPPGVEVRAMLESQFLYKYICSKRHDIMSNQIERIIVTGGASANKAIQQVIADIFNRPVYTRDVPNSTPLGGCYRAKLAVDGLCDLHVLKGTSTEDQVCAAKPNEGCDKIYEEMASRYMKLFQQLNSSQELKS